ncbi:MAG: hypothetical protein GKS06_08000 [Acidobacteria bacterium]|nr:hypothetical protein [Acidobacteriota bacterium]
MFESLAAWFDSPFSGGLAGGFLYAGLFAAALVLLDRGATILKVGTASFDLGPSGIEIAGDRARVIGYAFLGSGSLAFIACAALLLT